MVRTPQQLRPSEYHLVLINNNREEDRVYRVFLSALLAPFHSFFSLRLFPCLPLQGSGPEDFSHLPPEQRRKKLQGKLDDLNKDIQKEMDQRYFSTRIQSDLRV